MKVAGMPVQMLLDTGGVYSEISGATADELKLPVADRKLRPLRGVWRLVRARLPSATLEIGSLKADKAALVVDPGLSSSDKTRVGILAPDILRHYDVHLDFGENTLTLLSPDHCEGKVIYWPASAVAVVPMEVLSLGHIVITVVLDGKSVTAIIDTGASGSTLTIPAAETYFDLKLGSADTPESGEFEAGIENVQAHVQDPGFRRCGRGQHPCRHHSRHDSAASWRIVPPSERASRNARRMRTRRICSSGWIS